MGAVYRARDRELDELVALKVIRRELAAMPAMVARFRHEVKLARRVTHVNVARTFEIGTTADGLMYCTMELIDGESLSQRLEQRRKMPVGEAVSIVSAVCDGLATAHAAHVIHRDIKPDNILVASDGRVVLADFGVAAVGVEGRGELSGTPAYMAPEQARGEAATPSSDVYAVAVVLYELVTGRRAFSGEMSTVLSAKQAVDRVMPNEGEVPPELAEVIGNATARDPAQRIASAAALRAALRPWAKAPRAQTQPHRVPSVGSNELTTIVVLAPVGEHPDLYLAEAVHEEVLLRLGRMPRVRVLPRVGAITEENVIGVCFDLEDKFRVRITPPRGQPAMLELPLAVDQIEEVSDAVSAALGALVRPRKEPPRDATDLLLRARHIIARDFRRVPEGLELLRRAYELAPDEPRVIANYVIAKVRVAFFLAGVKAEIGDVAKISRAAVAAHPDAADVQLAAGHCELAIGDPIAAARHFRAAIRSAPHLAEAHEQLGRMLLESGYISAALARLEEAIAISPNLRTARWEIARALALDARWAEYDALVGEMLALQVDRPLARARYAWWRKDWEGMASLKSAMNSMGTALWPGLMAAIFDVFLEGKWSEHRESLLAGANAPVENQRRAAFVCQLVSEGAAFSGDIDTCIVLIVCAIDNGLYDLHWMENCPTLEPIRGDPRFPPLHALVKERAESILDALYGDHAAVSATQFA
jgi:serine/threonine-protein kinase